MLAIDKKGGDSMKRIRHDDSRPAWNMMLMTVLAAALGGAIGWTAHSYSAPTDTGMPRMEYGVGGGPGSTDANLPSDKMRLQYEFDGMLQEHVGLAAALIDATYDNAVRPSDKQDLDANSVRIADFIGDYYGQNARNMFLSRWRDHIQFYLDYTTAKRNGEGEQADRAKANLEQFAGSAAALLAQGNPNLSLTDMQEGLQTHGQQMLAVADMHAAGDMSGEQTAVSTARDHAKRMAVTIADAISKQFPNK